MEFKLNAQSSIKITTDRKIYFDPYLIEEETHDADYIFITHDHYDHLDVDSINKIIKEDTIIIMPKSIDKKFDNYVLKVVPNNEYIIDDLKFKTIPSYNTNKPFHKKEYDWVGYILELDEKDIYVAGDTDITEENKNVSCDIAFVPIGGTYTMDYQEAADLINTIKPRVVIPIHYSTIVGTREDALKFKELLDKDIECQIIME